MKRTSVALALSLLAVGVLAGGCKESPTYIVYVDGVDCRAMTWEGTPIDDLWVFPGDEVVWVNIGGSDLTIAFEDETIFGETRVSIAGGRRAVLTVSTAASGRETTYSVEACQGNSGSSRIVVGEEP